MTGIPVATPRCLPILRDTISDVELDVSNIALPNFNFRKLGFDSPTQYLVTLQVHTIVTNTVNERIDYLILTDSDAQILVQCFPAKLHGGQKNVSNC
jgi:hypothetical protein